MSTIQMQNERQVDNGTNQQNWLEVVKNKAEALRFGAVHITIHEGRVTQVESVERTRFAANIPAGR